MQDYNFSSLKPAAKVVLLCVNPERETTEIRDFAVPLTIITQEALVAVVDPGLFLHKEKDMWDQLWIAEDDADQLELAKEQVQIRPLSLDNLHNKDSINLSYDISGGPGGEIFAVPMSVEADFVKAMAEYLTAQSQETQKTWKLQLNNGEEGAFDYVVDVSCPKTKAWGVPKWRVIMKSIRALLKQNGLFLQFMRDEEKYMKTEESLFKEASSPIGSDQKTDPDGSVTSRSRAEELQEWATRNGHAMTWFEPLPLEERSIAAASRLVVSLK